jgi:hypothetical protein
MFLLSMLEKVCTPRNLMLTINHKPLDLHKQGLQYPMVIHGLVSSQTRKIHQTIDKKLKKN